VSWLNFLAKEKNFQSKITAKWLLMDKGVRSSTN